MRERLTRGLSESMCHYISGPAIEADNRRSFYNMADINMAHVLMLEKQSIIDKDSSKKLLQALWDMYQQGPACMTLDPKREEYYFNVESYIIEKTGKEIGGKMHTARSRNDLSSTLIRMNARDCFVRLMDLAITLQQSIIAVGEKYRDQVLTGYTHMQPAQPISVGYYMSAIAEGIGRDIQRMQEAYQRLNRSTMGGCAFAGTSFPIDREVVAKDLGFFGPVVNCMDAVAGKDYMQEVVSVFTILGSTINRFVTDLYFWSTDEFGYIEVDDSLAAVSSIMPQKKNPISIEHVRSKTSHLLSAFVSITMVLKGIPYCHNREGGAEITHLFWDACSEMEAILTILNEIVVTTTFKCDKMGKRAEANFCTVTELADVLVKKENIPFRTAHEIVAHIVRTCVEEGRTSADICSDMLDSAALLYAGRRFNWDDADIRQVLDPKRSVDGKVCQGGPAPSQCREMLEQQRTENESAKQWLNGQRSSLDRAKEDLHARVKGALM